MTKEQSWFKEKETIDRGQVGCSELKTYLGDKKIINQVEKIEKSKLI